MHFAKCSLQKPTTKVVLLMHIRKFKAIKNDFLTICVIFSPSVPTIFFIFTLLFYRFNNFFHANILVCQKKNVPLHVFFIKSIRI